VRKSSLFFGKAEKIEEHGWRKNKGMIRVGNRRSYINAAKACQVIKFGLHGCERWVRGSTSKYEEGEVHDGFNWYLRLILLF
jgi:hypothetical protein